MNFEIDIINNAKQYAIRAHENANHLYGSVNPYSVHLEMVYEYGLKYIHLVPQNLHAAVLSACWTHDLIEDTRLTYSDVKIKLGGTIAEITYALTNEKGKNRRERANDKYYEGIRNCKGATFVKLCDRLANVKFSVDNNSSMLNAYRKEGGEFENVLWDAAYAEMFAELELLLTEKPELAV